MEGRREESSGVVTVVGSEAPSDFQVAPRTTDNNTTAPPPQFGVSPAAGAVVAAVSGKKKRGRPRKYGPDGAVQALSPKPISSSVPPPVIDFSSEKRGKVRPAAAKQHHYHQPQPRAEVESTGDWVSYSVGANFTPHVLNVNAGEDVNMKIISFSQQGPRAICILSANGVISSVTLRQPDSSGGTLTYEGRFEILSLTGSFMPSESGGIRNRTGGMSVSLASPDGRVIGGGVAGLLVAAGPVQIVVGSFLAGNQHDQKGKKEKPEVITGTPKSIAYPVPSVENHVDDAAYRTSTSFNVSMHG